MEIFLGKTNGRKDTRKVLEETDQKRGQFQRNLSRRTTDIQNMTAITGKKLLDNMMKETTQELKKANELIKQNTHENKNKKNTIQEALISAKERHTRKEEPIQSMEKLGATPKIRPTGNRPCRFCGSLNWAPIHKCPAIETNCNKYGRKRHYAKVC